VPPMSRQMMTCYCPQRGLSLRLGTQWLVPTYCPRCLAHARVALEVDVCGDRDRWYHERRVERGVAETPPVNHLSQIRDETARMRAITATLRWADDAAQRHNCREALHWLHTITAAGNHLPTEYAVEQSAWASADLNKRPWRLARRARAATLIGGPGGAKSSASSSSARLTAVVPSELTSAPR
jgi:hypothetical protein